MHKKWEFVSRILHFLWFLRKIWTLCLSHTNCYVKDNNCIYFFKMYSLLKEKCSWKKLLINWYEIRSNPYQINFSCAKKLDKVPIIQSQSNLKKKKLHNSSDCLDIVSWNLITREIFSSVAKFGSPRTHPDKSRLVALIVEIPGDDRHVHGVLISSPKKRALAPTATTTQTTLGGTLTTKLAGVTSGYVEVIIFFFFFCIRGELCVFTTPSGVATRSVLCRERHTRRYYLARACAWKQCIAARGGASNGPWNETNWGGAATSDSVFFGLWSAICGWWSSGGGNHQVSRAVLTHCVL